jgi:hypothetical protein
MIDNDGKKITKYFVIIFILPNSKNFGIQTVIAFV